MGADTTTVSVYSNNILRHLCVIPLGGSNVTSDITSLKVEAEEAEELKKKYGTAYRSDSEDRTGEKINLSFNRTEDEEKLQEIVEARYEEIIANVCHHISAYKDKMLSGIIVTGGAARIPDLKDAFARQTGGDLNIRIVKGLPENLNVSFAFKTFTFDEDKKDEPEPVDQSDQNPPITPEPSDKKPFTFGRIWKTIEKMLSDESEGEDEKV